MTASLVQFAGVVVVVTICIFDMGFAYSLKDQNQPYLPPHLVNLTFSGEYGHYSDPSLRDSGSEQKEFRSAAIASDAPKCAQIALDILNINQEAIAEATIAALVCYGAVNPGYSGIGGGLQLVHYSASKQRATALISREKAPERATEDMFSDNPSQAERGGLGVAVPGEVRGFMELYKKFGGKVPWPELFQPTIKMLRDSANFDENCGKNCPFLKDRKSLLADTLQKISDSNGTAFYDPRHPLAKSIVADIEDEGGIISLQDLAKFNAKWVKAIKVSVGGYTTLYTAPPPSGGVLMAFVLRILAAKKAKTPSLETYQYLTEALKHAYGARPKIGDPDDPNFTRMVNECVKNMTVSKDYLDTILKKISPTSTSQDKNYYMDPTTRFVRPDHGTSAFAIVGQNGDAIVLTTTLNFYNGAQFSGSRTGIQFNNQMNDFSYKQKRGEDIPSVANVIRAGKRPLSSATPSIFVDRKGQVKLVAGGIGGVLIPGAVTTVAMNSLHFGKSMKDSLDAPRLHHILGPMEVSYEYDFDEEIIQGLENIGHQTRRRQSYYPGTACVGIRRTKVGSLVAGFDWRKKGSLDGY